MTVNIENFFNELLPAAMLKNPEYFKGIGVKSTFNITGEGGGKWSVDASNSGPSVTQGDSNNSDCSIAMSAEDFQKYYQNPDAVGMQLRFSGKMIITGNPMIAMKVSKLFNLGN